MITIDLLKKNIKELEEVQETCKMINTLKKRLKKHIKNDILPDFWATNLDIIKYDLEKIIIESQVNIYKEME